MTASLPVPPQKSSADTEGASASAEASASPPPTPRTPRATTPRAPRRPTAATASGAEEVDSAEAPKPAPKPRAPRTTAARAASGSGTTARTPAAKKPAAPKKPPAPRATAAPKAAGSTAAKPAAAKPAAPKKPATPRKPAAPRQTAAAKAAAAKAEAAKAETPAAETSQAAAIAGAPSAGIPPLLPDDIVVPPRPPLPVADGSEEGGHEKTADEPPVAADGVDARGDLEPETPAAPSGADATSGEASAEELPASAASAVQAVGDPTPADVAVEQPPTRTAEEPEQDESSTLLAVSPPVEIVTETPLEHDVPAGTGPADPSPSVIDGESETEDPTPADVRVDEIAPESAESESESVDAPASPDMPETAVFEATPAAENEETPVVDAATADLAPPIEPEESATPVDGALVPAVVGAEAAADVHTASDDETAVPALVLRTITKSFGELRAVDAIDLTVPAGAFYGLVGPNGAGKTTTLSMLTGLLRPDAGTATVLDHDVWADPAAAKRALGVLPDRLRLFDRLTGAQLLFYSATLRGIDGKTARARSSDLAEAFGLGDALGRPVADYSVGMAKKIALAATLIHSPRVLVLDEPFESVDPVSAATITEILRRYTQGGGTVVLSSHSMELVQRTCDSVAIIVGGKVLASGTMAQVRGRKSLEDKFVELAGGRVVAESMEWLHSFSG